MKKKLLGVLLASFALVSVSQARFYVGVEGGYSAEVPYSTGVKKDKVIFSTAPSSTISNAFDKDKSVQGYSIGVVFGTEDFFGKYFGTRWGIGAGYTSVDKKSLYTLEYFDLGLNIDLMLNFINTGSFSFGVFGGASADYHYQMNGKGHHFMDFSGRVGLSTLVASHHRIEFFAKLPIGSLNAMDDKGKSVLGSDGANARTTLGASYKFVF